MGRPTEGSNVVVSGRAPLRRRPFPPPFDVSKSPDEQGDCPRGDEEHDDDEPRLVYVEVGHIAPEATGQLELARQDSEELDGSDVERECYRQTRDRDVVVDLADRLG